MDPGGAEAGSGLNVKSELKGGVRVVGKEGDGWGRKWK